MLRLSKKSDYALLALQYLASQGSSGAVSTRTIAERFGIPGELLAKILQQLARHGVVVAQKGVRGGYLLARPAGAISVAEVVQAIDGPMTLTACSPDDERCEQYATCTVRDPLRRVRDRILSVLQDVTVADIDEGGDHHPAPLTLHESRTGAPGQVHAR